MDKYLRAKKWQHALVYMWLRDGLLTSYENPDIATESLHMTPEEVRGIFDDFVSDGLGYYGLDDEGELCIVLPGFTMGTWRPEPAAFAESWDRMAPEREDDSFRKSPV